MKDLGALVVAAFAALGFVAVVVFGAHDATTLVSPPEQVAEEFMRKVVAGRYELAANHLDAGAGSSAADLQALGQAIHAGGATEQVEGVPGAIAGEAASASIIVTTSEKEMRFDFTLNRRHGVWKIATVRDTPPRPL